MPWEDDVAVGDSGSPVRAGKQRPETGCHAPGSRERRACQSVRRLLTRPPIGTDW